MSEKLISILMPVKNPGKYLQPCIESILRQSENNWELIAVNDHSTDGSNELLRLFEDQDDRIKVLDNEESGIVSALQMAYRHSKGDLIHRMDSDDIMPTNKLKVMSESLKPGFCVTGKVNYFSDDWMVGLGFQNYESWINTLMDSGDLWSDIYVECPIPSSAWMMFREDFERVGTFDSEILPEDYDLCFRIRKAGLQIEPLKEVVHHWRDSQNRTSRKDPVYFPHAYYPIKLKYFIEQDLDRSKPLILWGAGKKGKRIASMLDQMGIEFLWHTDNPRKQGLLINGLEVSNVSSDEFCLAQTIIAVASPEDKLVIQSTLDSWGLKKAKEYWWFC